MWIIYMFQAAKYDTITKDTVSEKQTQLERVNNSNNSLKACVLNTKTGIYLQRQILRWLQMDENSYILYSLNIWKIYPA